MKKIYFLVIILVLVSFVQAQTGSADSSLIISLNQQIDNQVVKQDTVGLYKLYGEDFVFSHGSGKVEGKHSWLRSVGKGNFISRQHDSVTVELHPGLAIVKGKLSVQKRNKDKIDRYHLKYIRVYAFRNRQWEMISHSTTSEYHE